MAEHFPRLADFKDHADAVQALADFQLQQAALEQQVRQAEERALKAAATTREDAALRLVEGGSLEDVGHAAEQKSLKELRDRLEILRTAVDIQRRRVDEAHAKASFEAGKAVLPLYRQCVQRVAKAVRELAEANEGINDVFARLHAAGFNFTCGLHAMQFRHIGRLNDYESDASRWLRDAAEHGLV